MIGFVISIIDSPLIIVSEVNEQANGELRAAIIGDTFMASNMTSRWRSEQLPK